LIVLWSYANIDIFIIEDSSHLNWDITDLLALTESQVLGKVRENLSNTGLAREPFYIVPCLYLQYIQIMKLKEPRANCLCFIILRYENQNRKSTFLDINYYTNGVYFKLKMQSWKRERCQSVWIWKIHIYKIQQVKG
jgi:hypothetical protein